MGLEIIFGDFEAPKKYSYDKITNNKKYKKFHWPFWRKLFQKSFCKIFAR